MTREDLAGAEVDDGDLALVDDGEDPTAGMGHAELEVAQAAGVAQGEGAVLVGDVVAQAKVTPGAGTSRQRLGRRTVGLARGASAEGPVRPLLVVGGPKGVELGLQLRERSVRRAVARASA